MFSTTSLSLSLACIVMATSKPMIPSISLPFSQASCPTAFAQGVICRNGAMSGT